MTDNNYLNQKADRMRSTAYSFCNSFADGLAGSECLNRYFSSKPKITEHGPRWATARLPFLSITFEGRRGQGNPLGITCDDYYDLLTSTLTFDPDSVIIPQREQFAVDPAAGTATVRLHAKFASLKTGKDWEEDFVYVLSGFDEEGKIGCQDLWADPLSAWMAIGD
ncbi:MAG: hypothetical protein Q9164_003019 [Protoblastenia rupestris]